jgi:glyoxylate/hydroxypyruvate reductase A
MAIVLIRQDDKIALWKNALLKAHPELPVYSYLEEHPKEDITMALIWKHPEGSLGIYPNLKCIASAGAGVDYIFEDETISNTIPITRLVDPYLASDMSEHVLASIFAELKNFNTYNLQQTKAIWKPKDYRRISDVTIGIMGLGELGTCTSKDLVQAGFKVQGWSRSKKSIAGVTIFYGNKQLNKFLRNSDFLVCLLPLTTETTGILNNALFGQLPKGAYVINLARGGHLVDADLLAQLDSGHLSGACLDVYHQEPLAVTHPFWKESKIFMTPHYASVSDTNSVIPQILKNYENLQEGKALMNVVNRKKGY